MLSISTFVDTVVLKSISASSKQDRLSLHISIVIFALGLKTD